MTTLVAAVVVALGGGAAHAVRGGTAAADGAYPFAARVAAGERGCSGALVHAEYVLTLKSCFDPAAAGSGTVTVGGVTAGAHHRPPFQTGALSDLAP